MSSVGLAAPATEHKRWRVARPRDLVLCTFDDGCVVHDDLGAGIFQLTPAAGLLLDALLSHGAAMDAPALLQELLGEEGDARDLVALTPLLDGLRHQGLIEPVPL